MIFIADILIYILHVQQIIAEGVRGTGFTGDIAIDDFKFLSGISCQLTPQSADPNAPTTAPSTTATVVTTPVLRKLLLQCCMKLNK